MINKNNKAFTLIEIIISVAIFGIIMISIMAIFIVSSDTSLKADINRAMHENVKSAVSEIAEDIRKNGINGVAEIITNNCEIDNGKIFTEGKKLCTVNNKYFLAYKTAGGYAGVTDPTICSDIKNQCTIVKNDFLPLTNSLVTVKQLDFYISKENVKKVTVNIVFQPSVKAGVKPELIKNNELIFQTTVSERPF